MSTLTLEEQGESITFLSDDGSGPPRATLEFRLAPGSKGPPPHVHPRQSETVEVLSGRMSVVVEGQRRTLEAGESVAVQPGRVHSFSNAGHHEPLVARTTLQPPLHFEWFLSEMARSAIRNGGRWKDVPLLEAAYIIHCVRGEYRLAGIPPALHDAAFNLLARLAVLFRQNRRVSPFPETNAGRQP
jgi:mannose-6-phosphate isomerase-like protein (cupin superfamily)